MGADSGNSVNLNHWDNVIAQDPENADAYYQRAKIYEASEQKGGLDIYRSKLDLALHDIDRAISLRPDDWEYYALRQSIYYDMTGVVDYEVDREYLYQIAHDNAFKAYELGIRGTDAQYPAQFIVIDLVFSNQCQGALTILKRMIDMTPKDHISFDGLLIIQSQAYACVGQLDDAIKSIDDSMLYSGNMEYKEEQKAGYLIQLGRYDEALSVLNETFSCCGSFGGYRNYWRAEIYYKMGKKDLVQEELITGMQNTWGRGGMLPYVEAQIALDEGRKRDAIELLQFAEATLEPTFNKLRWQIQKQLAELGAAPLKLTPSVPYQVTPIP